jgi:hypothetical protein
MQLKSYAVGTLRALELLVFADVAAPELAASIGIHPRTTCRLLSELTADRYTTQGGGYRRRTAPTLRPAREAV